MLVQASRLLILAAIAVATPALAQPGLYVVTGFPTPDRPFGVQTRVVSMDHNTPVPLLTLCGLKSGCDDVLIDYDRRLLVVTSPSVTPSGVDVVSFDEPASSRRATMAYATNMSVIATHILETAKDPQLVLTLGNAHTQALAGFDLFAMTAVPMRWEDYGSVRVGGTFGVGQAWSDAVELRVHDNGLLTPRLRPAELAELAFKLPTSISTSNNAIVFLEVNNDRVAVISSSSEQSPNVAGVGFRLDHVYVKATRSWQTVRVPGAASWARGFGRWLAYVVAEPFHGVRSPGKEGRQEIELTPHHSVDELFEQSNAYFPGTLFLYDSATARSYQVETGQGDTEPLLVDGNTFYYRVNSALYQLEIGADTKNAVLIGTDPLLSQAHWAFISSAADHPGPH